MMVLKVEGLQKKFITQFWKPAKPVLLDIHFSVPKGSLCGFVGVNGSGKTTTMKCILGLIKADQGKIFINQESDPNRYKRSLSFLPERPYFHEFLTAKQTLRLHWDLSFLNSSANDSLGFEESARSVLQQVRLLDVIDQRVSTFSKGMQQRLGIAQALITRPELLILDEPMSGLDPDGRVLLKKILVEQNKQGTSIFFSTHLLSDIEEICDHAVVIDGGKMIYSGDLKTFKGEISLESQFASILKKFRGELNES